MEINFSDLWWFRVDLTNVLARVLFAYGLNTQRPVGHVAMYDLDSIVVGHFVVADRKYVCVGYFDPSNLDLKILRRNQLKIVIISFC